MIRIAIANPPEQEGLTRTVIDGALQMPEEVEFRLCAPFDYPLPTKRHVLSREAFTRYAKAADLFIYPHTRRGMQTELAEELGLWEKTVYLDGSEPGRNRRLDPVIREALLDGTYADAGGINWDMRKKCPLYFRRERPHPHGIIPFPFGIERRYTRYVKPGRARPIDFVCMLGQEEYPPLRREVRGALEAFCKESGFTCFTKKTWTKAGFYRTLARAKVGISVSGGGFDSYRFWETLGAGCILLTETLDIDPPPATTLDYERIYQFTDLAAFKTQLAHLGAFIRERYDTWDPQAEYAQILAEHGSRARVQTILAEARRIGRIT